ncbi:MAG: metalloregulator ArsR/SmtB family transcription factor [Cytophagales bacterium]|nr:metalloregulator ArsR/SmtB family transcription factor [Cytophagales bacterium]
MGLTKSFHFDEEQNQLASFAKAFAHPARIAILQQIIKNKTCIVGNLTDILPLSQSTISQHLKELKNIGIIKGEIEGPSICYCIHQQNWHRAKKMLTKLFSEIDRNCC